ncbi:MAG: hypothetical protein U0528_13135 [Anaerolineae bacterium]
MSNLTVTHRAPLWLFGVVLALIAAKGIEVVGTLRETALYQEFALPFSPTVRIAFAGFWLIALLFLMIGLWRRLTWAYRWCAPLLTLYAISHMLWQLLFFRADFDRGRLLFQIGISVVLLIPLWLWVWTRRR